MVGRAGVLQYKHWLDNTSILAADASVRLEEVAYCDQEDGRVEWPMYVFDPEKHAT